MERKDRGSREFQLTAGETASLTVSRLSYMIRGREEFLSPASLAALENDPRAGVRSLAASARRCIAAAYLEKLRLQGLCIYEQELWDRGITRIAGLDEAGMGPLAGPVVAAAVVFPPGLTISGVDDSKKLSPGRREALAGLIKEQAAAWATGQASPREIDEINIYHAALLAMRRAIAKLDPSPQHLLIDARRIREIHLPQTSIIRGDSRSFTIAAASVLAKHCRDALMSGLDRRYPGYGFASHKGYPTKAHREALLELGPTPEHRRSFSLYGPASRT